MAKRRTSPTKTAKSTPGKNRFFIIMIVTTLIVLTLLYWVYRSTTG